MHRLAVAGADVVRHVANEWSLVIAGHTDDGESGVSITKLNSITGCDQRAAIDPQVREGRTRGDRAGQGYRVIELHQVGCAGSQCHAGNGRWR